MTTPEPTATPPTHVDAVRHFNRFYTQRIGVLADGILRTPFSLTEVRVLYELAHLDDPTATELGHALDLDPGYLSRILRSFVTRGLVERRPSTADGRQRHLRLTRKGRTTFGTLVARTNEQVGTMLQHLAPVDRARLAGAMQEIEHLLGAPAASVDAEPYVLRSHRPGDMGWIVHRHGALYAREYGYDEHFEALVAGIVSEFVQRFDPKRERCWIAERHGAIVGSVFLVQKSKTVAKLRLLYVEPDARGLGIGKRLVDECVRFAREAGYRTVTLWTQSHLDAARHIYQAAGFQLVSEEAHHSFSLDLVAQTWELALT